MSKVNTGHEEKGLNSLQWPEVQNDLARLPASKDFRTWVYSDGKGKFVVLKGRKLRSHVRGRMLSFPKRYKGKRLTKNETLFLLHVHRRWGGFFTAKPEHLDSLLAMYRLSTKQSKGLGVRIGTVFLGVVAISFAIPFGVAFPDYLKEASIAFAVVATLISGGVSGLVRLADRFNTSSGILHVWHSSSKEVLHSDFVEFHDFLQDWWKLNDEQRKSMGMVRPEPRYLETYKGKILSSTKSAIPPKGVTGEVHSMDYWVTSNKTFESVKKEWRDWEMDILKVIQYPTLFDMRESATVSFHRSLINAESKKPLDALPYTDSHPFVEAVADLQLAWDIAKGEARRIRQSNFAEKERVRLSRAVDLLRIALNSSGTPAERQTSYKQALKQLEGLVQVPAQAVATLESGIQHGALEGAT